jgi:hypothetical protein
VLVVCMWERRQAPGLSQPKNGRVEDLQSTSDHIRDGTVPIAITPTTRETGFVGKETSSCKTGKSVEYAPGKGMRDE